MNEPQTIERILRDTKTIAVVGLSDKPDQDSFRVARYMQENGYRIVPVNPEVESVLSERAYPDLDAAAADHEIDLVNVFRKPTFVPEIVKDAMRLKLPAVWLQLGIMHDEATDWAEAVGILAVADRCLMVEHQAWLRNGGGR